ncbi:hypothetical protein CLF_103767 [Clonorchis sinensis]|uniref:Uncharacterized protein n=1 Tax=Clonorchis sinensis TaxID=79923 RepID=G7YAC4_CLOSI|nr:hypothetical protein CLF_103767 [Clonorchis sinensis]
MNRTVAVCILSLKQKLRIFLKESKIPYLRSKNFGRLLNADCLMVTGVVCSAISNGHSSNSNGVRLCSTKKDKVVAWHEITAERKSYRFHLCRQFIHNKTIHVMLLSHRLLNTPKHLRMGMNQSFSMKAYTNKRSRSRQSVFEKAHFGKDSATAFKREFNPDGGATESTDSSSGHQLLRWLSSPYDVLENKEKGDLRRSLAQNSDRIEEVLGGKSKRIASFKEHVAIRVLAHNLKTLQRELDKLLTSDEPATPGSLCSLDADRNALATTYQYWEFLYFGILIYLFANLAINPTLQGHLKTQTAKCNYRAQLEDQLRDRLIAGVQLPELQKKLLLCPDRKLQPLRKICEQYEDVKHSAITSFSPTSFVELDRGIDNFLMQYVNVVHSATGKNPAFLFKSRSLRTSFDCAKTADVTFFKGNGFRPATGIIFSSNGKRMVTLLDLDDPSSHQSHIDHVEFNTGCHAVNGTPAVSNTNESFVDDLIVSEQDVISKEYTTNGEPEVSSLRRSDRDHY